MNLFKEPALVKISSRASPHTTRANIEPTHTQMCDSTTHWYGWLHNQPITKYLGKCITCLPTKKVFEYAQVLPLSLITEAWGSRHFARSKVSAIGTGFFAWQFLLKDWMPLRWSKGLHIQTYPACLPLLYFLKCVDHSFPLLSFLFFQWPSYISKDRLHSFLSPV